MAPDVIIIGSGVGGGAVAHQLAPLGLHILMLERGEVLPKEPQLTDAREVFQKARYRTRDEWQDASGRRYRPGQYYQVGGHTKFYGTAMFRFRASDFDGAWPIGYDALEPFYDAAERLFGVRGAAGIDPTEPPRSAPFAHAAIPHEPVIARLAERLAAQGLRPFPMPSAVDFGPGGGCVRCGTCDAFACAHDAKGDAETRLIRPLLRANRIELWTGTEVLRLILAEDGRSIGSVEIRRGGEVSRVSAPLVVLSAGAINSALILMRSATEGFAGGLANSSGVVGRHLMNHHLTGLMALDPLRVNATRFPKTLAVNDFYHGLPGDPAARGNIQMLGKIGAPMIQSAYPAMPGPLAGWLGRHSVDILCMSEDPPNPESRVRLLPGERVEIDYRPLARAEHDRFVAHVRRRLRRIFPAVLRHDFGIEAPSHQCGTVRMGADPRTSALDAFCRAHDHPNLHVVDAGFFPTSAALNPALTVAAQALRVGAHLRDTWPGRQPVKATGAL